MRIGSSEVDVLVFDLFGVVISFDNDVVYSRLARHCADPADAFGRLNGLMASRDIITGETTLAEVHQRLVDTHGLKLSYPEFEAAWLAPYSEAMPGMAELLEKLSEHYRLVLLSNIDQAYWEVVRGMHPELEHFESLLVSCDLGMAKPDREIFQHVCQLTGREPSQCLFVDDTALNVGAARRLGFRCHQFRGVSELYAELKRGNARGI